MHASATSAGLPPRFQWNCIAANFDNLLIPFSCHFCFDKTGALHLIFMPREGLFKRHRFCKAMITAVDADNLLTGIPSSKLRSHIYNGATF